MGSNVIPTTTIPASSKPGKGLLWFWLIILVLAPLFPLTNFVGRPHWEAIRWIPFQDFSLTRTMLVDIIGNIGWFTIFGYLLDRVMDKRASCSETVAIVTLITAGISFSLEFFQVFCINRCPSMTDVVCNTIGAGLGAYFSKQRLLTHISRLTSSTAIKATARAIVLLEP